MELNNVT